MYQEYSFKDAWLSDPATYPIMAIMVAATSFIAGMSANAMMYYKNIGIKSPKKSIIPDSPWDHEHHTSVTEIVARNPVGFHADLMKSTYQEGIGYDHERWLKTKEHKS
jgi:hypothetical protein